MSKTYMNGVKSKKSVYKMSKTYTKCPKRIQNVQNVYKMSKTYISRIQNVQNVYKNKISYYYIMHKGYYNIYSPEYDNYGNEIVDEEEEELKRVLDRIEPFFKRIDAGKKIVNDNQNYRGVHTFVNRGYGYVRDIIGSIIDRKNVLIESYRFLSTFTHNGVPDESVKKLATIKRFLEPYTLIHQLSRFTTEDVLNQYKYKFINVSQQISFTDTPKFYFLNTPIYLSQEDVNNGITTIVKSHKASARQSRKTRQTKIALQESLPKVGNRDLTRYTTSFFEPLLEDDGLITDLTKLEKGTTYLVETRKFRNDGLMEKFICTFDGVELRGGRNKKRKSQKKKTSSSKTKKQVTK
jgi:hypothetical protein